MDNTVLLKQNPRGLEEEQRTAETLGLRSEATGRKECGGQLVSGGEGRESRVVVSRGFETWLVLGSPPYLLRGSLPSTTWLAVCLHGQVFLRHPVAS